MITFKAKPWKLGGSYVVTIPAKYVKNNLIPIDQEVNFATGFEEKKIEEA